MISSGPTLKQRTWFRTIGCMVFCLAVSGAGTGRAPPPAQDAKKTAVKKSASVYRPPLVVDNPFVAPGAKAAVKPALETQAETKSLEVSRLPDVGKGEAATSAPNAAAESESI